MFSTRTGAAAGENSERRAQATRFLFAHEKATRDATVHETDPPAQQQLGNSQAPGKPVAWGAAINTVSDWCDDLGVSRAAYLSYRTASDKPAWRQLIAPVRA